MNLPSSHSDWDAPEVHEFVREITAIVREADERFEVEGGSSRHWVRDHFLPGLEAAGFEIVQKPPPRRVTTPHDDPIVQACVDHGGHFWPEQHEDQTGPPTCTRCWFNPGWVEGKIAEASDLRPVRDVPQA